MKSKPQATIIPTISAILFVIAVAHLGAGIFKENKGSENLAKARFEAMLGTARSCAEHKTKAEDFKDQFEDAVGNLDDFGSIRLSVNEKVVYDYASQKTDARLRDFYATESISSGNSISLSATIGRLGGGIVYNHSRIAFFLILSGTVLSVIGLFFTTESESNQKSEQKYPYPSKSFGSEETAADGVLSDEAEDETDIVDESEVTYESDEEVAEDEIEEEESPAQEESSEVEDSVDSGEVVESEEASENDAHSEQEEQNEIESREALSEETVQVENQDENQNEVSDGSSFKHDLGEQLRKNEYKEISLTLIRLKSFDWTREEEILSLIKEHFGQTAEVYKYDAETLSVVLNGVDLETTITSSEAILIPIEELVGEGFAFIGISAMSYRAIPADRLIVEAEGALSRAESDPKSPIVAFKANPERYKQEIGNEIEHQKTDEENS